MNPDAVDRVAATLRDVAADLEQHAPRIEGLLDEVGRSSRAAQDARRTAELYGSLSEDLRKLVQLVREADAQGAPRPVIDLLIGRPWGGVRTVLRSKDPAQVFHWWQQLSAQQQAWLKAHYRDAIAGLDGIPVDVRNELNRKRVTARLWQLYAEQAQLMCAVTRVERARLEKVRALIASHEAMLAPDLTVLLYDPAGDGQAAVAIGDVTAATHIGVLVPGITNQLDNYPGIIGTGRALDAEAKRQGSTQHAVIAWLGYDTPELNLTPAGKGRAQQGVQALMRSSVDCTR